MRVLVTGAGGMTGSELARQSEEKGWHCRGFKRSDLDIADADAVNRAIDDAKPDIVFNAGAYTSVDAAESARDEAMRVNAGGARNLARASVRAGATMVHISTDYVFDGKGSQPYVPTDPVNPLGVYGRTKLAGEIAVKEEIEKYVIVRTSWVHSHNGNNFVRTMLRTGAERPELRVVDDQHGSPTSASDLAAALLKAGEAAHGSPSLAGTYHFTNAGVTTWYEFAKAIFELRTVKVPRIIPIATSDYPTAACRPAWSALDSTSFQETFGVTPRPWREALRDTLEKIA